MKKIKKNLKVSEEYLGERLDVYLSKVLDVKRKEVQEAIEKGEVLVFGKPSKSGYKVRIDDEITLDLTLLDEVVTSLTPEDIPLDIVYEDEDLILINKPKGLVVHPGAGNYSHTLVNALLHYAKDLSSLNGAFRPGIVHRLDKDTWGLLLVAKNDKAHAYLAKQLENRLMHRSYLALVKGTFPNNKGEIDAPIGRDPSNRLRMKVKADGKKAISYYEVKKRFSHYTLLNLDLKTGRTHQLRAHLAFIDHPIVGDDLYGGKSSLYQNGQLLVAYKIVFKRPKDEKLMEFDIPLPKEFEEILLKLKTEDTSPII